MWSNSTELPAVMVRNKTCNQVQGCIDPKKQEADMDPVTLCQYVIEDAFKALMHAKLTNR